MRTRSGLILAIVGCLALAWWLAHPTGHCPFRTRQPWPHCAPARCRRR